MKKILLLSGENLDLAREEALAVAETKDFLQNQRILIIKTRRCLRRLAFTKKIFRYLFDCEIKDLEREIKKFNWQKFYNKNFCVRKSGNCRLTEQQLASLVWSRLRNPKVKLKNAETQIYFLVQKKRVYCGLLLHKNRERFFDRRPHLRKGFHPTSIQPKLARAIVNLTGIKKRQVLLDPFCGTGGILIEAGLLGCKLKGTDIDKEMIERSRINLSHFKLKAELKQKNALDVRTKVDAIVTDVPYGRRSSAHKQELKKLYKDFMNHAYSILKKNKYLVIVFPKKQDIRTKLRKVNEFNFYVHATLTRIIAVYKKD